MWKEDVFIIQSNVKTSSTSCEGKLKYGLLTESLFEEQHPLLVPEVSLRQFYFDPVVKLQAACRDMATSRGGHFREGDRTRGGRY